MGVKWTPKQQQAIDMPSGEGNILVSAAAGSGKTAVLVERIFQKIKNERVDIDRFLVVTFTNAAADGMKEKIEQRFRKEMKLAAAEEKLFWQRQIRLIDTADINTMDAYCLNTLRNNFQNIGIDPNFFIIDQAEYKLLCDEIIEKVFEELYDKQDSDFLSLIDKYASFKDDKALVEIIFKIHSFISNFAEPMQWLEEKSKMYNAEDMTNGDFAYYLVNEYVRPEAKRLYAAAKAILNDLFYDITGIDGEYSSDLIDDENYKRLTDSLEIICGALKELYEKDSICGVFEWNKKYDDKEKIFKASLPIKLTKALKEIDGFEYYLSKIRELIKQIVEVLEIADAKNSEEFTDAEQVKVLEETANQLYKLTKIFDSELMNAKHRKNAYTFLDIEHMTYELFKGNDDIRRAYTDKYYEILIDEYQDTNGLQDAIFASISNKNIFMVGDLKQSIYRFRGGDPYIFKEKSISYKNGGGTKIELANNFRSRTDVIDSVNDVFDAVMSDEVGDVDYVGDERLQQVTKDEIGDFYCSELHVIKKMSDNSQKADNETLEAEHIAREILRLKGQSFYDKKNDCVRPLRFSDFTILVREKKRSAPAYEAVFKKYGIPLVAEVNDYFENCEIKAMLALLSVIDNIHQDIPLVTALRSALFNFSDNDLAYIKVHHGENKEHFYESVSECADSDNLMSKKCRRFMGMMKNWREYIRYKNVAELIRIIYEETGFYDYVAVAGGETAQSNLLLLYERAKQYESTGSRGLFSFVKYMDNLKERNKEVAGARAVRNDTVTLMTIHKSKGLEFPVVFLGGMGKNSLKASSRKESRVLLHKDIGLGLMYPDVESGFYSDTIYKRLIEYKEKSEEMSEKMRVLYVAVTRAQYKLFTVAVCEFKDNDAFKDRLEEWNSLGVKNIRSDVVATSSEYVSWIIPAAIKSTSWRVSFFEAEEKEAVEEVEAEEAVAFDTEALKDAVYRILDYKYKYNSSVGIPSRTTATEMKAVRNMKKHYTSIVAKPMFMNERKSAAKRGTAYHNAVAFIDIERLKNGIDTETINDELERMYDRGYVNKKYSDDSVTEKLIKFFSSDLGQRLIHSKCFYREKNFQVLMDSSKYKPSIKPQESEKMILQGVIDCFFLENDGNIVLIDFKTDKIRNGDTSAVKENYALQLELYSMAIKNITNKEVNEAYLYLFDIDEAVKM